DFFSFRETVFQKRRIARQPTASGAADILNPSCTRSLTMAARSLFSWLKATRQSRTAARRRRSSVRLRLEALEDPAVPGMITVTSLLDNTTVDGKVTLREALQAAETDTSVDGSAAGSGADTITFAPEQAGATLSLSIVGDTSVGDSAFAVSTPLAIQGPTAG